MDCQLSNLDLRRLEKSNYQTPNSKESRMAEHLSRNCHNKCSSSENWRNPESKVSFMTLPSYSNYCFKWPRGNCHSIEMSEGVIWPQKLVDKWKSEVIKTITWEDFRTWVTSNGRDCNQSDENKSLLSTRLACKSLWLLNL